MTAEEIKRIVDGERTERLTVQMCSHWEIATDRLEKLVQELNSDMDTCAEAEIYAALMRMQSAVMALMELNKLPSAFLFAEYFNRIAKTLSNISINQSVMTLMELLLDKEPVSQPSSFFQYINQSLSQHMALSPQEQEAIQQNASPLQQIFAIWAQHMKPENLMMVANIIQNINAGNNTENQEETNDLISQMHQQMDNLSGMMGESLQMMLIWLMILMLLPSVILNQMRQKQKDSKVMANLLYKVHARMRESKAWHDFWKNHKETLKVVSDSSSWKEILTAERSKERAELGKVPNGLFAKWSTDREAFEAQFLDAGLSDEDLRHFIFHLGILTEIANELNPNGKSANEPKIDNEQQVVCEAVMTAATKLDDLVKDTWYPHYHAMWKELIYDETIFAHLKVTRKSPHNNLFTARFFCHLVGEMKKSAVFGGHSDRDLAQKLTDKYSVDTYRKNIQEGMGNESEKAQDVFDDIFKRYRKLSNGKQQLHSK